MSTPTDLPIHEVILKIMYNANREKPIGLTTADVLWKIDNPEITEQYIREVLDWLVRQKKVELYLDKYSLNRYEFLEQRAKSDEEERDVVIESEKETFYIKPSKKKIRNLRSKVVFFAGIVVLGYVIYLFTAMERNYEIVTKQIMPNTLVYAQRPVAKLFLSHNREEDVETEIEEDTEKKIEDIDKKIEEISYLFSRQNNNNNTIQQEITRLYKVVDSLQKQQQYRLNILQKHLNNNTNQNINYTNEILNKIIRFNILFLLLIIITFFRGKF